MYAVTDSGVLNTVEAWSVMLPLHGNGGEPFSKDDVDAVLAEILLTYPGFSIANTLGNWKGNEHTFVDRTTKL